MCKRTKKEKKKSVCSNCRDYEIAETKGPRQIKRTSEVKLKIDQKNSNIHEEFDNLGEIFTYSI